MTDIGSKPPRTKTQLKQEVKAALAWLKKNSSKKVRDSMARYGLPADKALGVPVGTIQKLGKQLGKDQQLAEGLWTSDVYEARLLVAYVGEPEKLTPALMNRWCGDFDNWGVVDTVCFKLFDQSPHAWKLIVPWVEAPGEFQRRAGFVLLACLAGHDREAPDGKFLRLLPLVERGASDGRNFVKKGVSWALRMIGRRNPVLHTAALDVARRLAGSVQPTARWVGRDAVRDLTSPAVRKKLAAER